MATITSYVPGSFCWADLATSDVEQAKKFYGEMFGWTAVDNPGPGGIYVTLHSDGNVAAAMYTAPPGMPPHWGVYFAASDVDASAARVASLGGKVVAGPFDVMDAGRMVSLTDPQGASFSLWQAKADIGATHGGPLSQVSWPELTTPEPAGAAAFYTALLGWKTKPEAGVESAQYIEWENAGRSIGGLMPMRGDEWKGVPPHWMIYITVADCDERVEKARQLGANVCVPPTDIPNVGRFSVITDAQSAVFSIVQLASTYQHASV
jgi:predicted enzyme related to lactoylglutathione lyase